jgi:hypothetical protein
MIVIPFLLPMVLWSDISNSNPYVVLFFKVLIPCIVASMILFGICDHISLSIKCFDKVIPGHGYFDDEKEDTENLNTKEETKVT